MRLDLIALVIATFCWLGIGVIALCFDHPGWACMVLFFAAFIWVEVAMDEEKRI